MTPQHLSHLWFHLIKVLVPPPSKVVSFQLSNNSTCHGSMSSLQLRLFSLRIVMQRMMIAMHSAKVVMYSTKIGMYAVKVVMYSAGVAPKSPPD